MTAAVLAFTLTFTLPQYEAAMDSCGANPWGAPEDYISGVACYDADTGEQIAALRPFYGLAPGAPVTWTIEAAGIRRVYVIAYDERQNASCPSNVITVDGGAPPFVGVAPATPPQRKLYDLEGRLVLSPRRSGLYFERITDAQGRQRVRRVVVLK